MFHFSCPVPVQVRANTQMYRETYRIVETASMLSVCIVFQDTKNFKVKIKPSENYTLMENDGKNSRMRM
jgi:hypothetical protein